MRVIWSDKTWFARFPLRFKHKAPREFKQLRYVHSEETYILSNGPLVVDRGSCGGAAGDVVDSSKVVVDLSGAWH